MNSEFDFLTHFAAQTKFFFAAHGLTDMIDVSMSNCQIPAFLSKLWQLVNDKNNENLVSWSVSGQSFVIFDQVQFAKLVLPNYFKHQKINSFIRQLNMYGFKKVPNLTEGTLHSMENESIEFANEFFIRNHHELMQKIKRKETKRSTTISLKSQMVYKSQISGLLSELSEQQEQTHEEFETLRDENRNLFNRVGLLQIKLDKQQETVNRLISFMIHFIKQSGVSL